MLDKQQVLGELQRTVGQITKQVYAEQVLLHKLWRQCVEHDLFTIVKNVSRTRMSWFEPLHKSYPISCFTQSYQVFGIDGSQIYPDRHLGIDCYLLNMGVVRLTYLPEQSRVQLYSRPFVYNYSQESNLSNLSATEFVNYQRAELELYTALREACDAQQHSTTLPTVVLFDGPVYFWHLYAHEQRKQAVLNKYIPVLHELHKAQVPLVGYTSFAKNKDILSIVQATVEQHKTYFKECETTTVFEQSTDADICALFLTSGTRTCVFTYKNTLYNYPVSLQPCFVYILLADELVRLEFSRWLLDNPVLFESMLAIMRDQCTKGRGYPVALAEAHEQAVIKGPDRDYFYELLHALALQAGHEYSCSKKSLHKRFVSY